MNYSNLIDWLEVNQSKCFFKAASGFDCLGCGFQRSLIFLLKGQVIDSFLMYPALIPFLMTFGLLAIHLIFKLKNGAILLRYSFILTSIVIVVNYLAKLYAFTL